MLFRLNITNQFTKIDKNIDKKRKFVFFILFFLLVGVGNTSAKTNTNPVGFALKNIQHLKGTIQNELEQLTDEKGKPIILSMVFSPFSINEMLLAPNLLVQASVTNTTPSINQTFYYVIKYRCASITEHCYGAQITFELPADISTPSIPAVGNIANVSSTGNAFTIDLESPASAGAPAGALAAGSAGAILIPIAFGCGDQANFPVGSTINFVADPVFSATGAGSVTDGASDVTVPVIPDCIVPPLSSGLIQCAYDNAGQEVLPGTSREFRYTYPSFTGGPYEITASIPAGTNVTGGDFSSGSNITGIQVDCGNGFQDIGTQVDLSNWINGCATDGDDLLDDVGAVTGCTCTSYTLPDGTVDKMVDSLLQVKYFTAASQASSKDIALNIRFDANGLEGTEYLVDFTTNNNPDFPDAGFVMTATALTPYIGFEIYFVGDGFGSTNVTSDNGMNTIPGLTKTVFDLEGQLEISVSQLSRADLEGFYIEYKLDEGMDFFEDGVYPNYWVVTAPSIYDASCGTPTFEVLKDYTGDGATWLRWTFPLTCVLPGETGNLPNIYINYSTRYNPAIGEGLDTRITHVPRFYTLDGSKVHSSYYCHYSNYVQDFKHYFHPIIVDANSAKYVKGTFDTDFHRYPSVGNTNLNGDGEYELYIYNSGTNDLKQVDFVDILPFIGDTDLLTGAARNSEWSVELSSDITVERFSLGTGLQDATADLGANGIMYSTSTTPCYLDVLNDISADPTMADFHISAGSCTDFDTSTPATGARAFTFQWANAASPLLFGEYLKITFTGVQLTGEADMTNGEVTWNSFGFKAIDELDISLPSTESIKVGLRMLDPTNIANLGNYVWLDDNANGAQDIGESGVEGVLVSLYEANGDTVKIAGVPHQTYTNASGYYYFYGLLPMTDYIVRLDNPSQFTGSGLLANYTLTSQNAGGDVSDSDAAYGNNNGTDLSADPEIANAQTGAAGTTIDSYDFGFYQFGGLGNYVWEDQDAAGDQDSGEPGVSGVKVVLYDQNDLAIDSTTTDTNGYYAIDSIPPGIYYVQFSSFPGGLSITGKSLTGNTENDSDANSDGTTDLFAIASGEVNATIDLGLKSPPANPASIKGIVWDDLVKDGTNAAAEPGLAGVTVELLDADGFPLESTTTDSLGAYCFTNLTPNTGYQIQFIPTNINIGMTVAGPDMDADPITGLTVTITPTDNETITGIDAGMCGIYSLGNLVWADNNDNGLYDTGEGVFPNVIIYLIDGTDGTTYLDTTITDSNGKYLFSITNPGDYIVEAEIPFNYRSSTDIASTTTPNALDSDDNGNGIAQLGVVRSNVITITSDGSGGGGNIGETDHGQFINGLLDNTSDAKAYYTADFGFKALPCALTITTSYSENCQELTANNFTADWKIGVLMVGAPDNILSYQRNNAAIQSTTFIGNTDTLTIAGIPADGGVYDTLKVWFTNDGTCRDTIILKRPLPCPPSVECQNIITGVTYARIQYAEESATGSVGLGSSDIELVADGSNQTVGLRYTPAIPNGRTITNAYIQFQVDETGNDNPIDLTIRGEAVANPLDFTTTVNNISDRLANATTASVSWTPPDWTSVGDMGLDQQTADLTSIVQELIDQGGWNAGQSMVFIITGSGRRVAENNPTLYVEYNKDYGICDPFEVCSTVGADEIAGTVFEDWNFDGVLNEIDTIGAQGIQVLAYDCDNNAVDTTYTDANGSFQFSGLIPEEDYRIEFILVEAVSCLACPTQAGTDNGTTVQFVQPGNCISLGIDSLATSNPIELGNYVWEDTNNDGIQDACEPGIDSIVVELVKGGSVIASTTTTNGGQYYFSSLSNIGSGSWTGTGADTALIVNTTYTIRIPNATEGSQQDSLNNLYLTLSNVNNNNSDLIDNDAYTSGTSVEISAAIGDAGCVDHSFDFGFSSTPLCITIDSLASFSEDQTICSGELLDTLGVSTTAANPDSIAFVYFTSQQTDSSLIYTNGTGLDTVQIAIGTDTVFMTNVAFPANSGSTPITYYVYAIGQPAPADNTCRPYEEIVVIINPLPSIVGRDTAICNGQTVDLSTLITGTVLSTLEYGTTFGTYGGSNSVSPSSTTTYFVRDSVDASGCVDTAMITVTVNALPSILGRDTAICNGQTVDLSTLITGTVLSTLEYGTTFGTYGGSNSVSPSSTTTYFVRDSVDASSCVDTAMITVTVNALPSILGRDTAICNGQTIDLSTLITGTVLSTLEYGTTFGTYGGSNSVSPSSTTTYFVRDSVDASGCVDTAMITVTVNPLPSIVGRDTAICNGQTVDLSTLITGTPLSTLEYGTTFGTYGGSNSVSPSSTTTYFVRDSVDASGCVDTAMITVTVNPLPSIVGRDTAICNGQTVDLSTLITGTPLSTLEYGTTFGTYGGSNSVSPSFTTTYFVRDSVDASGCVDTAMITVTVNPLPSIVGRDTAICNGQTVDLSTLITGTPLSTLEYGTTFGTYGGSNSVSPSSTTTYFVRDSVDASGCVDTAMITVTVNPLPSIVGRDTAICNGQTVDLSTLITGTPLSTLEYGTTFGTYGGSNSVSPSSTTTYFVRDSVDASGCVDTAMITVTVNPLPSIVGRDTAICNGQTVDLSTLITGTPLSTLEYGTTFGTYGGSNSVSPSFTTTYFVRDSVDASGCVDTAMITVTVNPLPSIVGRDTAICNGQTVDLSTLITGTPLSTLEYGTTFGTYGGSNSVSPSSTTTYFVRDSVDASGCVDTAMITVTVNPLPSIVGRDTAICNGQTVDLSTLITGTPLSTLEYGTTFGTYGGSNSVSPSFTTTYFVRDSVDASGCVDTAMITVTVNPLPSIVGRDTAICNGQTVDLSTLITGTPLSTLEYGTTFGTYGGSNSVSPSSTTTYFVRDSVDASGCVDTAMITVTVNPLPSIVGRDTAICNGQTVDLSTLITGTPLSTLEYGTTFGTYGGSNSVSPSFTTTYFVRDSVDASGCVDTAMITVTVNPLPSIVGRDTAICNGQTVDLSTLITGTPLSTLEYGTTFGTYGGSNSVSPSSTTTYFVRDSVDASGCVDTAMITVTVNPLPSIVGRDTAICNGQTVDLSTLITGTPLSTLEYGTTFGTYGGSNSVSPSSTTTYFVRDSCRCIGVVWILR